MQIAETTVDQIILDVEYTLHKRGRQNILLMSAVIGDLPVLEILQTVQSGCDGACAEDSTGFNRNDLRADVNGLIAYLETGADKISFNGIEWALRMCVFYQRQWLPYFEDGTLEGIKAVQKGLQDYWN